MTEPTKAQGDILFWLWEGFGPETESIRGGDLVAYYEARWLRERNEQGRIGFTAGSGKAHAWRRSGGTQLAKLHEAGWLRRVDISWGVPIYAFSKKALEWIESQ